MNDYAKAMNLDEVKKLWVAKYNLFTDVTWIGTVEEMLRTSAGQFKARASLSALAKSTDEESMKTKTALQGIIIGFAETREGAADIVSQMRRQ